MTLRKTLLDYIARYGRAAKFAVQSIMGFYFPERADLIDLVGKAFDAAHDLASSEKALDEELARLAQAEQLAALQQLLEVLSERQEDLLAQLARLQNLPHQATKLLEITSQSADALGEIKSMLTEYNRRVSRLEASHVPQRPIGPAESKLIEVLAASYIEWSVGRTTWVSDDPPVQAALKELHRSNHDTRSRHVFLPLPCPSINPLAPLCRRYVQNIGRFARLDRPPALGYLVRFQNPMFADCEDLIYSIPGRSTELDLPAERALIVAVLEVLRRYHPELANSRMEPADVTTAIPSLIDDRLVQASMLAMVLTVVMRIQAPRLSEIVNIRFPIPKEHPVGRVLERLLRYHIEDCCSEECQHFPRDIVEHGFKNVIFLKELLDMRRRIMRGEL